VSRRTRSITPFPRYSSLRLLFKTSRRDRMERMKKIDILAYEPFDLNHVREKHPLKKEGEDLLERLGKANTRRKQFLNITRDITKSLLDFAPMTCQKQMILTRDPRQNGTRNTALDSTNRITCPKHILQQCEPPYLQFTRTRT
jgi:hypothetical protein